MFKDQKFVDALVDDIAYTLGVSRDALNIVSTVPPQRQWLHDDGPF
jgi:DNA topoisomerase VI subunit A